MKNVKTMNKLQKDIVSTNVTVAQIAEERGDWRANFVAVKVYYLS